VNFKSQVCILEEKIPHAHAQPSRPPPQNPRQTPKCGSRVVEVSAMPKPTRGRQAGRHRTGARYIPAAF